ncbi:MAG: DUF883 domain-containing protein [Methylococcaceae bacterium]
MDTIDKTANSARKSVDKVASATNQSVEMLGEKGKQLKNAEQQLMRNYRSYVRYNPWVSQ